MEVWSTYRIRDFLLFSRDILFEVIEAYNYDVWPWQLLWLGLAAVIMIFLLSPSPQRTRVVFGLTAVAWACVGLVFHLQYFSPINWAARYAAGLCVGEALLLAILGGIRGQLNIQERGLLRSLGIGIFFFSAFIPLELAWGYDLAQIMGFGWGPDRTALGTIGLLLAVRSGFWNWILILPALIWCGLALLLLYALP
jgi:hypothetical protein